MAEYEETPFPGTVDRYFFAGVISEPHDDRFIELISGRSRGATRCVLFLNTVGGSPSAAYRVMAALQHAYAHVTVVVDNVCMSAGTLMVLGAQELAMSGRGRLGPLDIQVPKEGELGLKAQSGLAIPAAFQVLGDEALAIFRRFFLELKLGADQTTQTASETAAAVTVGLMGPIYRQLDPVKLGEHRRANTISWKYGERLIERASNLPEHGSTERKALAGLDVLAILINGYADHGTVIDRTEAKSLFTGVRHLTENERQLANVLRGLSPTLTPPQYDRLRLGEHVDEDESEHEGDDESDADASFDHGPSGVGDGAQASPPGGGEDRKGAAGGVSDDAEAGPLPVAESGEASDSAHGA